MQVSLITVAFNSAHTIVDTLRSVTTQRNVDIQHIIIDGGSTDRTVELARKYAHPSSIIHSGPDAGIYDAMNKGLRLATGDVIGFLNADDVFASDVVVSHIANAIRPATAPTFVYGDLDYFASSNSNAVVRRWRAGEYSARHLRLGWMPPHPTFYINRELAKMVGFFDTSLRIAADYDFMLRCIRISGDNGIYLPETLVLMRLGGVSNRSLRNIVHKSREDLAVIARHDLWGSVTLVSKNLRKVSQFFKR